MPGPRANKVGFFSRRHSLARADGRTHAGKLARSIEAELLDHLGGPDRASAPQRLLARSTAVLALRLSLAAERFAEPCARGRDEVESLDRHFCSLVNSLRLNLVTLGMERPAQQAPSLAEHIKLVEQGKKAA